MRALPYHTLIHRSGDRPFLACRFNIIAPVRSCRSKDRLSICMWKSSRHPPGQRAITVEVLRQHLSVYFRHVDQDYKDLKKILGIEPLQITLLKIGTFARFQQAYGHEPDVINPSKHELYQLMALQQESYDRNRGDRYE